jgi:hypothetical protein
MDNGCRVVVAQAEAAMEFASDNESYLTRENNNVLSPCQRLRRQVVRRFVRIVYNAPPDSLLTVHLLLASL